MSTVTVLLCQCLSTSSTPAACVSSTLSLFLWGLFSFYMPERLFLSVAEDFQAFGYMLHMRLVSGCIKIDIAVELKGSFIHLSLRLETSWVCKSHEGCFQVN